MRRMAMVLAVVVGLGALGLQQAAGGGGSPGMAQEEEGPTIDERATRLRKRLGPLCRNFDFYYRHRFANGEMRPVRCSRVNRDKTVLLIYAFSDRDTKKSWLGEWGDLGEQRGAVVLRGKRWTVEVLVRRWAREARERL